MNSSVLTAEAKKEALAAQRARIDELKESRKLVAADLKTAQSNIKLAESHAASVNKTLAKIDSELNAAEERYSSLKASEVVPPRVSPNGKRLGRPPLTAEEKERRRIARETGIVEPAAAAPVAVPTDLQPLIPTTNPQANG